MPIDFPNSPANGATFSTGDKTWQFDGVSWVLVASNASIGNSAITEAKIASGAVTADKIGALAVTTGKIDSNAVTAGKIASNAVTEGKIDASAVTSAKIAAGAVVEAGIAANAVTTGKLGTDVQLGYRNVVINGAMQIAQRGTSVSGITTSGYRTVDRFQFQVGTMGTWTQTVETDAPFAAAGMNKSVKVLCTTADASPAAGDLVAFVQRIEGQNLQQFLKGADSAKQFTLTFWVKSNVTGTYIAELLDADNTRQVSAAYTVSASGTWEKKTITFPADTTGAFNNDNDLSLTVAWWLGAGTNFTSGTLQTTWVSTVTANRAVGQTNLAAATNNYWQITGVQLEAGSVATPFEFEDFSTTLRKCERYFEKTYEQGVNPAAATNVGFVGAGGPDGVANFYAFPTWRYRTEKRATPTVTIYDIAGNSARITTWQSGFSTNNVTPDNGNWTNGTTAHAVLENGAISGFYYQAVSSAEL